MKPPEGVQTINSNYYNTCCVSVDYSLLKQKRFNGWKLRAILRNYLITVNTRGLLLVIKLSRTPINDLKATVSRADLDIDIAVC